MVCACSRQRKTFCQSVSWYFGHPLSAHCRCWACTDGLVTVSSDLPGETAFSSRKDGHLVFLHTYIFSNICPFLDITRVSVCHIKIVYKKCFEAKRQVLGTARGQCSSVTQNPNPGKCLLIMCYIVFSLYYLGNGGIMKLYLPLLN